MNHEEIENKVRELPEYYEEGGEEMLISRPVLKEVDGNLFAVYMSYDFIYEGIPTGFFFVELSSGTASYLDVGDGRLFLRMPDEVFLSENTDERPQEFWNDDMYQYFDRSIENGKIVLEDYWKYLDAVVVSARPGARPFYRWFIL